jgi:hypothetical protein
MPADLDLLGPGAAGAPRAIASSDPSITATIQFPDAADTWMQDCVNNTAGTGTPYVAEWANRLMQQLRRVIRISGVPLPYADDLLGFAIQQGLQWIGTFGGAANALTAIMVPASTVLVSGMEVKGIVGFTNTHATTLNVNGIGAFPVTKADGTPLAGGEMVAGGVASFVYTGSGFVLLTPAPSVFVPVIPTPNWFVDPVNGTDAPGQGMASGTQAFKTKQYGANAIAKFFSASPVSIGVAGGTDAGLVIPQSLISGWNWTGAGAGSSTISAANGDATQGVCVHFTGGSTGSVAGFAMSGPQGGIVADADSTVSVGTNNFSNCGVNGAIASIRGSFVFVGGLTGGASATIAETGTNNSLLLAASGGTVEVGRIDSGGVHFSATLNVTGATMTAATAQASPFGTIAFTSSVVTWAGTPNGARHLVDQGRIITGSGTPTTYVPGSTAGSAPNGGIIT